MSEINQHRILDTKEYMCTHYSVVDQLYNDGGLNLVAKPYFKWGIEMVKNIKLHLNEEKMKRYRNDVMKIAFNICMTQKWLQKLFLEEVKK